MDSATPSLTGHRRKTTFRGDAGLTRGVRTNERPYAIILNVLRSLRPAVTGRFVGAIPGVAGPRRRGRWPIRRASIRSNSKGLDIGPAGRSDRRRWHGRDGWLHASTRRWGRGRPVVEVE